jgi:hypothetical protein
MSWKVTVRDGPKVGREKFADVDGAIAYAERRVDEIRREGGLPTITAFRKHTSGQRVKARIEISGPGLIRSPQGGIDLMGDGTVIAYTGAIRKETIEADSPGQAFERLRAMLHG